MNAAQPVPPWISKRPPRHTHTRLLLSFTVRGGSGRLLSHGTYRGLPTVGHGGADAGYRSQFLRFPDQHLRALRPRMAKRPVGKRLRCPPCMS